MGARAPMPMQNRSARYRIREGSVVKEVFPFSGLEKSTLYTRRKKDVRTRELSSAGRNFICDSVGRF